MKKKTINSIITNKIKEWLDSIEDVAVRKIAAESTIVTGGCVASMLLGEKVSDFDIYFRNLDAARRVAEYYVSKFQPEKRKGIQCKIFVRVEEKGSAVMFADEEAVIAEDRIRIIIQSAGVASETGADKPYEYFESQPEGEAGEYVGEVMNDPGEIEDTYDETKAQSRETNADNDKPKYRPVFISTNAITLSNRVQLVFRFFGEPDDIHANYDFVHCTNYWTSWDKKLILRQDALESLMARDLFYVGSKYPVCSIFRLRKFIRRGWTINAGQILKILMQASALDLTDIHVLQDQLTGVDCAYFMEVIEKLRDKDPEKVNSAHLIEIVNRMF